MKNNNLSLPDIEKVCAAQHKNWVAAKQAAGIASKITPEGQEMMVEYDQLNEEGKNIVRNVVNGVYKAIEEVADVAEEKTAQQEHAAANQD